MGAKMSLLDKIGGAIADVGGGAVKLLSAGVDLVATGAGKALKFFGDLASGNLGEQPIPISEVVTQVKNGDSRAWHEGADHADKLAREHEEISARAVKLGATIAANWRGEAADLAVGRVQPLADVSSIAAESFRANGRNLKDIAHTFDTLKHSMNSMPPRPDKSFYDVITPWDTETEKRIHEYNVIAKQNLDRYDAYARQTRSSAQGLQHDYGHVGTLNGAVPPPGGGGGRHRGIADFGNYSGGPGVGTTGENLGYSATDVGNGARPPLEPDTTSPAGNSPHLPPSVVPGSQGPVWNGDSSTSPSRVTPTGLESLPRGANGGGFGAVGDPAGGRVVPPLHEQPVAGVSRQAGTGAPRGPAGGAIPVTGRSGAAGMANGMGGAPGRGKSEDDVEHRNKYAEHDETIFALDGDGDGEKSTDPETGMRVLRHPAIGG